MKSDSRCPWAKNALEIRYHDEDWGKPKHDDYTLFYMLILEGMQAGLSWSTILQKWDHFFQAFDQFNLQLVSQYDDHKIQSLLENPGIIRNRLKVQAAVTNAQAFINIQSEWGSFSKYLWHFVNGKPIQNAWEKLEDIPASTELSKEISNDLKKRGFKFVGPTIVYAYMQSVGLVNDHLVSCTCYESCRSSY